MKSSQGGDSGVYLLDYRSFCLHSKQELLSRRLVRYSSAKSGATQSFHLVRAKIGRLLPRYLVTSPLNLQQPALDCSRKLLRLTFASAGTTPGRVLHKVAGKQHLRGPGVCVPALAPAGAVLVTGLAEDGNLGGPASIVMGS